MGFERFEKGFERVRWGLKGLKGLMGFERFERFEKGFEMV